MILRAAHPARIRRFIATVRSEGWHSAWGKARFYLRLLRDGGGHSNLSESHSRAEVGQTYLESFWRDMASDEAFHVSAPHAGAGRRVVMIGNLNLPQCRKYRVEQLADVFAIAGVEYEFAHVEDVRRAVTLLQGATHAMFYRTRDDQIANMLMYEARRLSLPVAYDIDDPLFSVPAYETYGNMEQVSPLLKAHFVREAPRYLAALNQADIVTVSTPGLAEHAKRFTSRPVIVRRNFIDTATQSVAESARGSAKDGGPGLRIAFSSGSQGHEADFQVAAPGIAAHLAGNPDSRLMILGHFDLTSLPDGLSDRVDHLPFADYADYLAHLASADVAVMPLRDDLFNRCKSGVRVLDAMAVGVPSLVSDVGDLAAVALPDAGRVVADDGWQAALDALAGDRADLNDLTAGTARAAAAWGPTTDQHIVDPALLVWLSA